MRCPFCGELDTKVIDSRLSLDGYSIKRRRSCPSCNSRYNTQETTDLSYPRVIKNDKSSEVFSKDKVRNSMYVALEKRQASAENIDKALQNIFNRCITNQEKEISTLKIGEFVMQELLRLDHVAYVRYASVYLSFNEIDAFKKLVDNLKNDLSPEMKKLQKKLLNEE
tara:strand:- start:729 stop:1229 length:501 start_codon:yes stop_codon:yes gene_type:complete